MGKGRMVNGITRWEIGKGLGREGGGWMSGLGGIKIKGNGGINKSRLMEIG